MSDKQIPHAADCENPRCRGGCGSGPAESSFAAPVVSLPKLRLLVVMWAGRGEPNSLTCAKELARTILPALSETEAAELAEAIEKQKAG